MTIADHMQEAQHILRIKYGLFPKAFILGPTEFLEFKEWLSVKRYPDIIKYSFCGIPVLENELSGINLVIDVY